MRRRKLPADDLMIRAAARAILLRGFPGCTMRLVADQAGISLEHVRRQFPRRECLVTAVVERAAGLFNTPLASPANADTDRKRLTELLNVQLATVNANRELFLVAIMRQLRPDEYPPVPSPSEGFSRLQVYFSKFEQWLHKNTSAVANTTLQAHVLGGAVIGLLLYWGSRGGRDVLTNHARRLVRMVVPDV